MIHSNFLTTMAGTPDDIRKLRRQKLLQFSEQRMKRILQSDGGSCSSEASHDPSTHLGNDEENDACLRVDDTSPTNTAAESSEVFQPKQREATNNSSTQDALAPEAAAAADTDKSHMRKRVKTNDAFAESKFPGITASTPSPSLSPSPRRSPISSGTRSSGPASNKITLSLLQFELVRLISCVVLALLTRRILNTAWSLFFAEVIWTVVLIFIVIFTTFRLMCPPAFFMCFLSISGTFLETCHPLKSILVPFTLLQLGIYTFLPKFCKGVVLPERGSMIVTCLILCGVEQSTIGNFHRVIGYSASIAEDIAVYIFSFVMADFLVG